ncbi:MAG: hypothetical protein HC933_08015 [Pleurocapsa sp. SU_196_0]|nr:hypothetical protein [Pleurocapsa sp. SU_196_0]
MTPHNRTVDIEAVGLVLLGVAVFFGASLYLQLRPLEGLKSSVIGAMGWSAYLIPVPFLVFGFLAFIRQNARLAARVMLGLSVMAFAGLLGTGLYEPKLAGSFANGIAGRSSRHATGDHGRAVHCQHRIGNRAWVATHHDCQSHRQGHVVARQQNREFHGTGCRQSQGRHATHRRASRAAGRNSRACRKTSRSC